VGDFCALKILLAPNNNKRIPNTTSIQSKRRWGLLYPEVIPAPKSKPNKTTIENFY
jgi:hypothetical protein